MRKLVINYLAILALSGNVATAAAEPPPLPLDLPAGQAAAETGPRPALAPVLPSILEPAAPASPDYRFSVTPPAQPATWELLLGALLAGIFIAYRRLSDD